MNGLTFLKFKLSIFLCFAAVSAMTQDIEMLSDNRPVSLRGLSVVDDNIIWVSGSKGTVGKSADGGKNWVWITVPGYEDRDFRDIEAFDKDTAVIIAIAEPANILRTTNGGNTWELVYENKSKGMFLDAMDFAGHRYGTVVGDAVEGKFFVAHTSDGGKNWEVGAEKFVSSDSAEGCFASSGTNIRVTGKQTYYFVSGGKKSRLVSDRASVEIPFSNKKSSMGANSLAIRRSKNDADLWVVVGGDFAADSVRERNCFISKDRGKTWLMPRESPSGYRSCVEFISNTMLITCGLNGVDISNDEGNTWKKISSTGFHACRQAKRGKSVFLSGGNGRVARLVIK